MRRFFVSAPLQAGHEAQISGDEFHHLKNVSRLEEGERVELLDGQGLIALAEISNIGKKSATLQVKEVRQLPPPSHPHVRIVLGVPRFQKMDLIIQKCAELGATEIIPVVSDRSFVKRLSKELDSKVVRWNKISLEACKQSGRAWPMKLGKFSTLTQEIEKSRHGLFLYEGESALDIKKSLSLLKTPEEITVFIGAEGGFSPAEVEKFKSQGLSPVTLGPLVLRVETACITILSVIQYHFDLMR